MILADTGPLYAAADRRDRHHHSCDTLLAAHAGQLLVPTPVIVECAWLLNARLGPTAETAFIAAITTGELIRVDLTDTDWQRTRDLVDQYADNDIGLVDASVIAVAERLDITTIATVDHRHFTVVRPTHTDTFELIP